MGHINIWSVGAYLAGAFQCLSSPYYQTAGIDTARSQKRGIQPHNIEAPEFRHSQGYWHRRLHLKDRQEHHKLPLRHLLSHGFPHLVRDMDSATTGLHVARSYYKTPFDEPPVQAPPVGTGPLAKAAYYVTHRRSAVMFLSLFLSLYLIPIVERFEHGQWPSTFKPGLLQRACFCGGITLLWARFERDFQWWMNKVERAVEPALVRAIGYLLVPVSRLAVWVVRTANGGPPKPPKGPGARRSSSPW